MFDSCAIGRFSIKQFIPRSHIWVCYNAYINIDNPLGACRFWLCYVLTALIMSQILSDCKQKRDFKVSYDK